MEEKVTPEVNGAGKGTRIQKFLNGRNRKKPSNGTWQKRI